VMNTDNMSIIGLTIDYGPYGWLEGFDQQWTPNTTDAQGRRYRYGNQANIALWNLVQLANAIYPLINSVEPLQKALQCYTEEYTACWQRDMQNKLGLQVFNPTEDKRLVDNLFAALESAEIDMTIFFRNLASFNWKDALTEPASIIFPEAIREAYYTSPNDHQVLVMKAWLTDYAKRLQQDYVTDGYSDDLRSAQMNMANPKYVLRNYLAQQAIEKAEQGDFTEVHALLQLLQKPYDEQPEYQSYFTKRPDWARNKAGCSMLSCSS
jgi:serine/tyrosine/threonine adenylyltransferase